MGFNIFFTQNIVIRILLSKLSILRHYTFKLPITFTLHSKIQRMFVKYMIFVKLNSELDKKKKEPCALYLFSLDKIQQNYHYFIELFSFFSCLLWFFHFASSLTFFSSLKVDTTHMVHVLSNFRFNLTKSCIYGAMWRSLVVRGWNVSNLIVLDVKCEWHNNL